MAADYELYAYESDAGLTHPIRLAVTGAAAQPTSPVLGTGTTSGISALVGGSRRRLGLRARGVRLRRTVGAAPNQGTRSTFLPILSPGDWLGLTKGSVVTLNSLTYTVTKQVGEEAN